MTSTLLSRIVVLSTLDMDFVIVYIYIYISIPKVWCQCHTKLIFCFCSSNLFKNDQASRLFILSFFINQAFIKKTVTSPRVESLFTDRTPQLRITFTPLHTWTDTSIARSAQTNSDHCISDFQRPVNYSTCVLTTRVLVPRPIVLVPSSPPDLCTRFQPAN